MFYGSDFGKAIGGLYALAMVGLAAIAVVITSAIIAIPFGIWWLCHHVTIH